jgi:O-antigen ligase
MAFSSRNLDSFCERGILSLILAILVFSPLAFGAVYPWTFIVVEVLTLGVALLWLVRLWGGHKPKFLWPPLAWAVVAFVLYAVARYFTADVEYIARQELIRVLLYSFLFIAVLNNLYSGDNAEMIVYALVIVAALDATYALAQFVNHSTRVWNEVSPYIGRGSGTYINPDHFCAFLELVLPLALAFLLAARIGAVARVLLAYAALTIVVGIIVTFSRGGWLATGVGIFTVLTFLLCHRNHRLRAALVLLLLIGGGGGIAAHELSGNLTFVRRIANSDENAPAVIDASDRLRMWRAALQMWSDHPAFGVGPGHFDPRFRQYRPEGFQLRPQHAHNDYLELLADWGTTGAVIIAVGIGCLVVGLRRTWPSVRREETDFGHGMSTRYAFFIGATGGLAALAVHSLVDFNLHIPADALAGIVILALLVSNVRFATERHWFRARLPFQCAATVLLLGVIGFLGNQAWRLGGNTLWIARAEAQPNFSAEQAAALGKALDCEPRDYFTAYNIGECYRIQSWQGDADSKELAEKALPFYALASRLNLWDARPKLRYGMCLDWLDRHAESEPYYSAAEELDPNGNFVVANIGWHYLQISDYAAARQWFIRAFKLGSGKNEMANTSLLQVCEPKLIQKASGQLPMQFYYRGKDN